MAGRVVIRQDGQGLVRFNLLDEDGTVLSSSKGFDSADAARAGAERARALLAEAEVIDQTAGGGPTRSSSAVVDPGTRS
jgi:uncharacterized protein YegP (UPF0339 family)